MTTIIAECGINHCGCLRTAMSMVVDAREAGADAVKFQLFTGRSRPMGMKYLLSEQEWRMVLDANREDIKEERLEKDWSVEDFPIFFSVFDFESVDMAARLGAPWVKLSFVERRNSRLIARCNKFGFKRKFVSVDLHGQYNEEELNGWEKLYCPNNGWSGYYPTEDHHIEWEEYLPMAREYGLGWSCHCRGIAEPILVAAHGARVIEKHFKISDDCPDANCSLDPGRFKVMVDIIRKRF